MLLLRSLLFNFFLYFGITLVFLIAIPTLFLPAKFTLFFGKFLGHYVILIVRIFLNTKVEIKGINNIPRDAKYFVASPIRKKHQHIVLIPLIKKIISTITGLNCNCSRLLLSSISPKTR